MKDGIKYGDFEPTKKTNHLAYICKDLYNECYYLLINIKYETSATLGTKLLKMFQSIPYKC